MLKQFFKSEEASSVQVGEVRCEVRNKITGEVKWSEVAPAYAPVISPGSSLKHKVLNLLKLWRY